MPMPDTSVDAAGAALRHAQEAGRSVVPTLQTQLEDAKEEIEKTKMQSTSYLKALQDAADNYSRASAQERQGAMDQAAVAAADVEALRAELSAQRNAYATVQQDARTYCTGLSARIQELQAVNEKLQKQSKAAVLLKDK